MNIFDKTYAIGTERFIINDNGMIVRCGRLMTDFLRLILDIKLYAVHEALDEMKMDIQITEI
jgi:hypothetical protein